MNTLPLQHRQPARAARRLACNLARVALGALAAASFACTALAAPFSLAGKVIHVDDGDTVVLLLADHTRVNVRLASIDAPESSHTRQTTGRVGQPHSRSSTRYLADLVKGREVTATCHDRDRYQRSVCDIMVDGRSANREMVAAGWAWANVANGGRYLRDRSLVELERSARERRLGLWADANPIAPWEWRRSCWDGGSCPGHD